MLRLMLKDTQGPLQHLAFPQSQSSTCLTLVSVTDKLSAPYREKEWGGASLLSPFQNLWLGHTVEVNNQTAGNIELKKKVGDRDT